MKNKGLLFLILFFLLVVISPGSSSGSVLDNWYIRHQATGEAFYGITQGNGIFVAVGEDYNSGFGKILTSTYGIAWTEKTTNNGDVLNGVSYGGGTFVAVGTYYDPNPALPPACKILTSTDNGATWTDRSPNIDGNLNGISYGDGIFVAVGDDNNGAVKILTSDDNGATWTESSPNIGGVLWGITYGDGTFVSVGADYDTGGVKILTSNNSGAGWTDRSPNIEGALYGITYANGTFVTAGEDYPVVRILASTDNGSTWTDRSPGINGALYGITYGDGSFVAAGADYDTGAVKIVTSNDGGSSWTERSPNIDGALYGITFGHDTFVAVGEDYGGGIAIVIQSAKITFYGLTVTKPTGGTVTDGNPPVGINCGTGSADCTEAYVSGTVVTLTAVPDSGYAIGTWTGCNAGTGTAGSTTCQVTMSAAKTVAVTFKTNKLTVTKPTGGTVTAEGIICGTGGTDCTENIAPATPATVVTLTAVPDSGYAIGTWTGCNAGTGTAGSTTCQVTMSAAKTVAVTFKTNKLTVTKPAGGTVTAEGITCGTGGTDCTENIAPATPATVVTLTAVPDRGGYAIGTWTGCNAGTGTAGSTTCQVTMSAAKTVAVTFKTNKLTVTKPTVGKGYITSTDENIYCGTYADTTDCTQNYSPTPVTTVTLIAIPDPGYGIGTWTGCSAVNPDKTCSVTMSAARTVGLTFSTK